MGIGESILFAATGTAVAYTTNELVNNSSSSTSTQTATRSSDTEAPMITINTPTFDKKAQVQADKKTFADILKELAEQKAKEEEKTKAALDKDKQREKAKTKNGQGSTEHTSGARPSTKNDHQKGQSRKQADQQRSNNPNKKKVAEPKKPEEPKQQ